MRKEHPITLGDIRLASNVYVVLPLEPYWREEDDLLEEGAPYPGLGSDLEMPYPSLARTSKAAATELIRNHQSSARRIVGNTFDPFFFAPRQSGRNLHILRLHFDLGGGLRNELHEWECPIELHHVREASSVYVRVRMVESNPYRLEEQLFHRLRRMPPSLRRMRIPKIEARRLIQEPRHGYWQILGTMNCRPDGHELLIHRLGVDY